MSCFDKERRALHEGLRDVMGKMTASIIDKDYSAAKIHAETIELIRGVLDKKHRDAKVAIVANKWGFPSASALVETCRELDEIFRL